MIDPLIVISAVILKIRELQLVPTALFLMFYLAALTGDLLIITVMAVDRSISFLSCVAQVFLMVLFGGSEVFFLTVMFYDHYTAICLPQRFEVLMDHRFFCDNAVMVQLSCSETYLVIDVIIVTGKHLDVSCFVSIVIPFLRIFRAVLKTPAPEALDLLVSVLYTVVPPGLNTLIYSLRNRCGGRDHREFTILVFRDSRTNLSFIDLCCISVTVPNSIHNSLTKKRSISLLGCAVQIFSAAWFASSELSVLTITCCEKHITIDATAMLNMPTVEGWAKAFSFLLHFGNVTVFLSADILFYFKPPSDSSLIVDLLVSVFYMVVPPSLNLLIYCLRTRT
ncbi:olfactory receptor 14A16-like [Tachyglossus aculeatus]|uniref:olfactory receptor 14A16-like n=1 Tax=Tachyglossus aculeatus TaxID=9261 RepID=UPI0018F3F371|nr:olfactory receptor 14A16-like [Tachyglossus aculeatus]